MDRILVIGDNLPFSVELERVIRERYRIVRAANAKKGAELLKTEHVSVVLLDLSLPDMNGIELVEFIHREIDPHLPVIIMADHAQIEDAVETIRRGAYDFVPKDLDPRHLSAKITRALERRELEIRLKVLQSGFNDRQNQFVFASDVMRGLNFEITRLARMNFDVLIEGETGVGKDLAAWELHCRSSRREKSFIPISMRALNEALIESELFGHEQGAFSGAERQKTGKFEAAHGGTVYIPEVSCLSESLQLKLLYFLQYKCISRVGQDPRKSEIRLDVRMILATNENLERLVEIGRLREDFYHRITGVRLCIPPLRERLEDIEPLVQYFLQSYANDPCKRKYIILPETLEMLKKHQWPGNVRELENSVKHAIAYADGPELKPEHFPHLLRTRTKHGASAFAIQDFGDGVAPYREAELEFRRSYFSQLLKRSNNDVPQAALLAHITPQGLRKILAALHLR